MKKFLLIALFSCISIISAEEMTVEKLKKIIAGKQTEKIREELKFYPIFEKFSSSIKMTYPDKEPFTAKIPGKEWYVEGKYAVGQLMLPNDVNMYSIMFWNEKTKTIQMAILTPDGKMGLFTGSKVKNRNRVNWFGTTPGGEYYKGYTDYSKKLGSWEGRYYTKKGGKYLYSESGNAVPVK